MYEYSSTHARNLTYTIILLYYTKVLLGWAGIWAFSFFFYFYHVWSVSIKYFMEKIF